MSIIKFPSHTNSLINIEDLWQEIVDNSFDQWREEVELQSNTKFTDIVFLDITKGIWSEITDIMLWIVEEDLEWEVEWYVLALVKQKVDEYRDRVISLLEENTKKKEKGITAKNVHVLLFGNKKK